MGDTFRGEAPMTGRALMAAALALSVTACTFNTEYALRVEPLSFVDEQQRTVSFTLSPDSAMDIYLLPLLRVYSESTTPNVMFREAYPVTFSEEQTQYLAEVPEEAHLRFRFIGETRLTNDSSAGTLPEATAEVYLAPLGTEDVYRDGERVNKTVVPSVEAESTKTVNVTTTVTITPELARSDGIRVGIRVRVPPSATEVGTIEATVTQTELVLELSGRPLRALP